MGTYSFNNISTSGLIRAATVLLLFIVSSFNNNISSCEAAANTKLLSPTFYDTTCPRAATIIRDTIYRAVSRDRRMAASLLRLHFHDCFVQGCDASILLDETDAIQSEKTAPPNNNSVRGYDVIEAAKAALEKECPGVVSCADILTLAARDASVRVGGPSWTVKLGRRDSTTASRSLASVELPSFTASLDTLISHFQRKGLNARDMVALSGAHTLGQSRCGLFRERIYNGTNIHPRFADRRRKDCPRVGGDANLAPLDLVTPNSFDNNYFRNLMQRRGLLPSDQVLYSGGSTDGLVAEYSRNPRLFASDFAKAMVKMSEIPAAQQDGIIRKICSAVN